MKRHLVSQRSVLFFEAFSVDGEVKFLPAGFGLLGEMLKILTAQLAVFLSVTAKNSYLHIDEKY